MNIEIRPTIVIGKTNSGCSSFVDLVWLTDLLKSIDLGKSLISAAKELDSSYRSTWDKLNGVENALGMHLLERIKGHGSHLTEAGRFLIQFFEKAQVEHFQYTAQYQAQFFSALKKFQKSNTIKWKFSSSSDSIIQQSVSEISGFELSIAGSGDALKHLLNKEVDIAGYHVSDPQDSKSIYQRLTKEGFRVFPVMKRIQGFIVKKGNPFRITTIKDLTNPKVRFINRQIGSGTRLLLDTLVLNENIDPSKINGYFHEEFTHSAVANAILANKADAALGVKNAAIENKLGFTPLQEEIFFLSTRPEIAVQDEVVKLIRKIRHLSGETPGYKSVGLNRQVKDWL